MVSIGLLQLRSTVDCNVMSHHLGLNLLNRYGSTLVLIHLVEEEPYLFLSDLR